MTSPHEETNTLMFKINEFVLYIRSEFIVIQIVGVYVCKGGGGVGGGGV